MSRNELLAMKGKEMTADQAKAALSIYLDEGYTEAGRHLAKEVYRSGKVAKTAIQEIHDYLAQRYRRTPEAIKVVLDELCPTV